MTPSRASQLEQGLNGVARKIYEAIPTTDPWPPGQIVSEIKRTVGSAPDLRLIQGTLAHLVEIGLVKTSGAGYLRVVPRSSVRRLEPMPAPQPVRAEPDPPAPSAHPAPASRSTSNTRDAITAIAEVSAKVRNVINLLSRLAEELDDVAVEIEEHHQATSRDADQLRKLRELLRAV